MRSPLNRIGRGGLLLLAVFIVAVIGYRFLGDYGWVDAVWMVVITISTVGYSETSSLSPQLQLFTVVVILIGMSAAAYTFGGLIQLMLEGEIERLMGRRRMTAEIARMKDHVIICGFGRIGQSLAGELKSHQRSLAVLESNPDRLREAESEGFACLTGDATEESILISVGIEHASTLVTALPSDADNVFITLTARNLSPNIQIIARAEQRSTEKKLRQAGANQVVMPSIVGSRQMARMITRPTTADLIELVSQHEFSDVELDELSIQPGSKLLGMTVRETEAHRKHKLLVVAIKRADGTLLFNPDANHRFDVGEVVILMGHLSDIANFRTQFLAEPT